MSFRRPSDLFALFFDPRVPVLFLIGSVVLAILGNGVYDLLTALVGSTPQALVGIVISALLIFVAVTSGFWTLLRRWRMKVTTTVPPEQRAEPHRGLILFVSKGDVAKTSEWPAIENHLVNGTLRHCWLIASPEAEPKARDLEFRLQERNVRPHIIPVANAYQARLAYGAVGEALLQAYRETDATPMIVDITAGTRPLAAGAVLACRDNGVPMEYMLAQYDDKGRVIEHSPSQAMKVELREAQQEARVP
jgi:hypothetical protein